MLLPDFALYGLQTMVNELEILVVVYNLTWILGQVFFYENCD